MGPNLATHPPALLWEAGDVGYPSSGELLTTTSRLPHGRFTADSRHLHQYLTTWPTTVFRLRTAGRGQAGRVTAAAAGGSEGNYQRSDSFFTRQMRARVERGGVPHRNCYFRSAEEAALRTTCGWCHRNWAVEASMVGTE